MTRIVEDNFKPAMNCASAVLDVVDHEDDIVLRKHEAVEATVVVGPSSNSFTTDGGGSFFVRSFSSVDDDERSFFRPQGVSISIYYLNIFYLKMIFIRVLLVIKKKFCGITFLI